MCRFPKMIKIGGFNILFKLKKVQVSAAAITICILSQSMAYASSGEGLLKARVIDILSTNPFSTYYQETKDTQEQEEIQKTEQEKNTETPVQEEAEDLIAEHKKYYKLLVKAQNKKEREAKEKIVEESNTNENQLSLENDAEIQNEHILQKDKQQELTDTPQEKTYLTGADLFTPEYSQVPEIEINEDASLDIYENNEDNADTLLFEYKRGKSYEVYAAPGYLTDVQLQSGESIENISIGDRNSWSVELKQGAGIWHIYLKPLQQGIATNMIINTDRHNYSLRLIADDDYTPIVSWIYPDEARVERKPGGVPMEVESVDKLNFDYRVSKAEKYPWSPVSVFDDGFKTYLVLKPAAAYKYMPAVFQKRSTGQLLHLDYKIINNTIVIDKVCDELYVCTSNEDHIAIKNFRSESPWE